MKMCAYIKAGIRLKLNMNVWFCKNDAGEYVYGNNSNINSSNITNMWNEIPSNKTEPVFAIDILFYILNQRKLTSKTCIEHFERYAKIQINYYLRWNKIATKKNWTGFEYYLKLSSCATKPFADSAHAHSALNS